MPVHVCRAHLTHLWTKVRDRETSPVEFRRYARRLMRVIGEEGLSFENAQAVDVTTPLGEQQVYHQGQWWTAQRYDRLSLPVGTVVQGPAILEQPDTTVWLEPGFEGRVDKLGNLLVERTA